MGMSVSSSVGLFCHGYPKPHAAMRATQVRSSVLGGGHLDFFFLSSPLHSLRDPFMHAQPTQRRCSLHAIAPTTGAPLLCMKRGC
jgi:hypothetical protein